MTPEIEKKRRELFDQFCADKGYGRFSTRELLWPCFNAALDAVEIDLSALNDLRHHGEFRRGLTHSASQIEATGLGLKVK